MKEINLRYMLSIHPGLGIYRLCIVFAEDEENYYGHWVVDVGDFKTKFPKKGTRALTEEEVENYNSFRFRRTKGIVFEIKMNYDGTPKGLKKKFE